jgi:hypothetical protein
LNHAKDYLERLQGAQKLLDMSSRQLAGELRVSEFWLSKVFNGHKPASDDLMLRLDDLLRRRKLVLDTNPKSGGRRAAAVEEPGGRYDTVASRIPQQRTPSTRMDCETYVRELLDAAEASNDPNAWPVILHRLRRDFPLTEWPPSPPEDT